MIIETYYDDELYHHGIKGQRWGIRRFQNEDGTLTDAGKAKLEKYRSKEQTKVDKYYAKQQAKATKKVDKLDEKRKKREEAGKDTKRIDAKLARAIANKTVVTVMETLEKDAVKNMTFKDMQDEKKAVLVAHGKAVAETMAANAMMSGLNLPVSVLVISNSRAVKANARFKREGNRQHNYYVDLGKPQDEYSGIVSYTNKRGHTSHYPIR